MLLRIRIDFDFSFAKAALLMMQRILEPPLHIFTAKWGQLETSRTTNQGTDK